MKKLPIRRIPYYDNKLKDKDYMTLDEVYNLFDGEIVITEKIDGSCGYEKFPSNLDMHFEDVRYKHTILYNKLPSEIIESGYRVYLGYKFMGEICPYNEICPPELFKGKIIKDLVLPILDKFMNLQSKWSDDLVEGIVVANYDKQLFGKISRFDSSGEIEEHWSKNKIRNYSQSDY